MLTNTHIIDIITNVLADLVKWLTHWIVVPTCVGSIPTIRPRMINSRTLYSEASFSLYKQGIVFDIIDSFY